MSDQNPLSEETVDRLFKELSEETYKTDDKDTRNNETVNTHQKNAKQRSPLPRALAVEAAMKITG